MYWIWFYMIFGNFNRPRQKRRMIGEDGIIKWKKKTFHINSMLHICECWDIRITQTMYNNVILISVNVRYLLQVVRQLLPLSKKRMTLIETFLRKSETGWACNIHLLLHNLTLTYLNFIRLYYNYLRIYISKLIICTGANLFNLYYLDIRPVILDQ